MNVYDDDRQSNLNARKGMVREAYLTPTSVVRAALDAPPVTAPDSQGDHG